MRYYQGCATAILAASMAFATAGAEARSDKKTDSQAANASRDRSPHVRVTSPKRNTVLTDMVQLSARARDDGGVTQVDFFVDGALVDTDMDGSNGWSIDWSTGGYADGDYLITALATDTAGNTTLSRAVPVSLDNDAPPTVVLDSPVDGATVSGPVAVSAQATDDNAVAQVEFFVGAVSIGMDTDGTDGWSANWDTTAFADGARTVSATATDSVGQTAIDSAVVTVNNDAPPAVAFVNPLNGDTLSGTTNVSATASDDNGVAQVEFLVGAVSLGTDIDGSDGWSASWTTTAFADGAHAVTAIATDTVGQTANALVNVSVDNAPPPTGGFQSVGAGDWTETAVRKVLHAFAYGGHASDPQITAWAAMSPDAAIAEMLTFNPVNEALSPSEDGTVAHSDSLEGLQAFWSSNDAANPARQDTADDYDLLSGGRASRSNLERTWVQTVNARGANPFLHKVGFYLTNYQMAISSAVVSIPLMRSYYDDTVAALTAGDSLVDVIAQSAASAAVARQYGHDNNRFNNGVFRGNDDFAREFHQLFFRIQGETEDPIYHEQVTIENTARMLTGMGVDQEPNAFGSTSSGDWWVSPILFFDHTDLNGRVLNNFSNHHANCLEILNDGFGTANICGGDAEAKIYELAALAGDHPESLDNLPVYIIGFFADDNLTDDKKTAMQMDWQANTAMDLLAFLRAYAISTTFHRDDTYKFRTAFNRNLVVQNLNTLSNEESFGRFDLPRSRMSNQGATVFRPANFVFGGQTGVQAANSPDILKEVYRSNVLDPSFLGDTDQSYTDITGQARSWDKEWNAVIPASLSGGYVVDDVAAWLWERFVADGGKHYDPIIQAQLRSILATGHDFGYAVDPANAEAVFSSADIATGTLASIDAGHASAMLALDSADDATRHIANDRVGLAVNLIAMTPYVFVLEGK